MLPVPKRLRESALESRGDSLTMSPPDKAPAQAPEYQYDALPDDQSIRMLTLYPGVQGDPLKGEL